MGVRSMEITKPISFWDLRCLIEGNIVKCDLGYELLFDQPPLSLLHIAF